MSERQAAPTLTLAPGEECNEEKFADFMRKLEAHLQTPVSTREEAMAVVEENMAAARAALALYEAARGQHGSQDPSGQNAIGEELLSENEMEGIEEEIKNEA